MLFTSFTRIAAVLSAAAAFTASAPAAAQYPDRAVRLVVPFAAGGGVDALARPFAKELSEVLGQSVVVENKASVTGQIGATDVARAKPGGYAILLSSAAFATTPAFYPEVPYDPVKDFSPITIVAAASQVMVANKDFKANSVADLIAMAKAGDPINFALSGGTGIQALATEMLASSAKVEFTNVPYKGAGGAFIDLISGQVNVMIDNPASSLPHVRSGKLKLLATTGAQRMAILPDTPAVAETLPGFEARNWFILAAPAGTPDAVVQKLNRAAREVLARDSMKQFFQRDGLDVMANSPAEASAFLAAEQAKWARVVKDNNLKP